MLQALSNNYACLQAHVNNALTWQSSENIVLQNVTGAYVIIVLVYRRLLTTSLGGKAAA